MSAPVDVLVVGHGLPELFAALDLAEVGLRVAVASGVEDLPETAERDPEGALTAALERLAAPLPGSGAAADPGISIDRVPRRAAMLQDRAGEWAPQPEPSVLGIPAVPLSVDALRLLGTGGALRAHLDRLTPLFRVGKVRSLGELIRRRLGQAALDRLGEPVLRERFGVPAVEIDIAIAAPGLKDTLSRVGSLTGAALAYSNRNVARETGIVPAGGWSSAQREALSRLELFAAERVEGRVVSIERAEGSAWIAELDNGACVEARALVLGLPRELDEPRESLEAPGSPEEPELPGMAADPWDLISGVQRPGSRLHAEIDIQEVPGIAPGDSAVRSHGRWSVRIECSDAGVFRAHALGPASEAGAEPALESPGVEQAELAALLTSAGLEVAPGATWRMRRFAAPFHAIAARDHAAEALREWHEDRPTLLVLGRAVHGDDLAAAVADGHLAAVALRRRLLGLAE